MPFSILLIALIAWMGEAAVEVNLLAVAEGRVAYAILSGLRRDQRRHRRDPLVVPNLGLVGRHSPALPYRGGEVFAVAEVAECWVCLEPQRLVLEVAVLVCRVEMADDARVGTRHTVVDELREDVLRVVRLLIVMNSGSSRAPKLVSKTS
jgi:hypothetical protein